MTIRFRSPVTRPLHPKRADGVSRPPGDDFYITQRFTDIDWYWSQRGIRRMHNATDIGNARCGYPIVAMAPGTVRNVRDNATALGAPSDALGVIVDHGDGVTSEYWHLASYSQPNGARASAGTEIGRVGSTGLNSVCHCHIELKINGVRIDPEPYMFGKTLEAGDDMLGYTISAEIHERWRTVTGRPFFTLAGERKTWAHPVELVASSYEIGFDGDGGSGRHVNYNGEPLLVPRASIMPTGERIDVDAVHAAVR